MWCGVASASAQPPATQDLKRMSLQEILDIPVTTVSRVPEPASSVAAAVFVLTRDDVRRSGATSIPELLRLVPGVQVARLGGGTWAIGIRGFADRLARSILVLIDGRAVYSPLFAGTYWETQDTLLEDIERIEVIRGPGGTLWGANAVNGIINIITRRASDTQGAYVSAAAGSELRGYGGVRYGATSGDLSYRAYAKAFDRDAEFHQDGSDFSTWHAGQVGARADWTLSETRTFSLHGDFYDGRLGERPTLSSYSPPFTRTLTVDAPLSGGNVVAQYSTGSTRLQMYYDHTSRDELPVAERRDTGDVDFQQTLHRWTRHTPTWGAGYRVTTGAITAVAPTAFSPERRTDHLATAFLQDEIVIAPHRWALTLGSKVEHNSYSGWELQPTARIAWTPDPRGMWWAAVTRAVRTPSRVETDYTTVSTIQTAPLPIFVRLTPNPDFEPERLIAYESGFRFRPADRVYVTFSSFYNDFANTLGTDLLGQFIEATPPPVHLALPVQFTNSLHGDSAGFEATSDVRPASWWRVTANYSYLHVAFSRNPGSRDVSQERHYEQAVPHHQVQATWSADAGPLSFDYVVRHISQLVAGPVPAYTASDARIAWRPHPRVELSLVAQDLFDSHHLEWFTGNGVNVEIERSVYGRVTWRR
jgi:iron complex outermembrane receptor protein